MLFQIFATAALIFFSSLLLRSSAFRTKTRLTSGRLPPSPWALPVVGHLHLLGPNIHRSFHHLSQSYGPIFRLRLGSKLCVVVSTPELAKEFLKTHEIEFAYRKHTPAVKILTHDVSFAFAPYGPYWKFIKKITTQNLLGTRNLNHFEPTRTREIHRFLRHLMEKAQAGQKVNLTNDLMKLASNIISQMMWGVRCSGSEVETENTRTVIREVSQIFGEFDVSDFIWFCKNLDFQGIKKRAKSIYTRYDALLEKIISDKEKTRSLNKLQKQENEEIIEENDFLGMLLNAMEDGVPDVQLSRNHIKSLILDFLTAATDTTAISLEWAVTELINNPKVLKKAQEEIKKVVGDQKLAKESDIPDLTYIKAIIKETFRLHPPIPLLIRKSINDTDVAGYHVPSNTMLFVNIWSIGRNPKYWESPLEFKPERFLESGSSGDPGRKIEINGQHFESLDPGRKIEINGQHFELLPFGTGRRGCPGMPLAMQELPTILALLVQCFDYFVPGSDGGKIDNGGDRSFIDMAERPGLTAPRASDLICLLKPRVHLFNLLADADIGSCSTEDP